MIDVNSFSIEEIERIFSSFDSKQRVAFVEACPPITFKEQALLAAKSSMNEMRAQTLDFLVQGCITAGPFDLGAKIGAACYRLARKAYEEKTGDLTTNRLITGRGAINWMTCLQRTGLHNKITELVQEPIQWLESIGDEDNLDMLRLKRVEAYVDLEDYDVAERYLKMINESSLPPLIKVSYNAIKYRIDRHKGGGTDLPEEQAGSSKQNLLKTLEPLIGKADDKKKDILKTFEALIGKTDDEKKDR